MFPSAIYKLLLIDKQNNINFSSKVYPFTLFVTFIRDEAMRNLPC